ncbi:hypothetical protein XH81_04240 [Bradyrhizobium sp. CCBAU 25360]|uniref:hypothetical protein n=1 Tax=Bradyrhizobium sp. CCBAU 25360 TaxID=858425 RepID=UPI002305AA2B|nr:hypothetical protein [Bradyrhizobium sp. CCBAU 25360]MDA9414075.1 hypothetical protein [Bradyrhizobium sp. CCBAU 25360]
MTTSSSHVYSALELQLGKALAATVAPEEIDFFDAIAAAPQQSGKRRDHELGFGVPSGDDLATISAALLVLCKPILNFIWANAKDATGQLIKSATEQARLALEKRLGDWFASRFKKPSPITIAPEKLEELIAKLTVDAKSLDLDEAALLRLTTTLRDGFRR